MSESKPWVAGEVMVSRPGRGAHEPPDDLHDNRQPVIAEDGFPLESTYHADIGVAPGERTHGAGPRRVIRVWVWHCHIFTHVARSDGTMFGMLTALIVEEE